jgi:4-hydroxy-3-methylbut-2-enyl diphosphate reductase
VDRAVEYAYETRERFPERRIFISGEIIHNPDVNARLQAMGIRMLEPGSRPAIRYAGVEGGDVVILPAFGVTVPEMDELRRKGCVLVDTTCGSVLNVWKNVRTYARGGFTSVIHGKHFHEETRATASQVVAHRGGRYVCVKDREEAGLLCDFIRGRLIARALLERLRPAASPGCDPERDLARIGLANQTTMLMSESLEIQEMLRSAMRDRHGEEDLRARFRAFDTICSATQDRQEAVLRLIETGGLDLMLVIGGYNSTNTQSLARICSERLPTYHIQGAEDITPRSIRYRTAAAHVAKSSDSWLSEGPITLGLTAGASTPNSVVGEVVERILARRGLGVEDLQAA